MRNALPNVEGYEKDEKLDIIMRPEQVSEIFAITKLLLCSQACSTCRCYLNAFEHSTEVLTLLIVTL